MKRKRGKTTNEINKFSNSTEGPMKSNVVSIASEEAISGPRRLAIRREHEEAAKTFAVESYLLDEMSEEEQMCFERHCLECPACSEAVEAGRIFMANITPLSEAETTPPWFQRVFKMMTGGAWLKPAAAVAVLWLPVLGWQQITISELTSAHANTVILARGFEKGLDAKTPVSLRTESATIEFCIAPAPEYAFYRVKISGGEQRKFSQVVPAPAKDAGNRLSVQVLRRQLGSGHFAVFVEGLEREDSTDGRKLDDSYEFDLN